MKKNKPIKVIHRKLGREMADGLAWKDKRVIEIDERLVGRPYLEAVIHEVFHCQNPKWPEITVNHRAKELSEILFEIGFRWVDI
jgi:hypothetical protein